MPLNIRDALLRADAPRLPTGPVRTKTPQGGSYGVLWERAHPYLPIFVAAGEEFGVDWRVMVSMGLIESTWTQVRLNGQVVTRDDGFGDGLSVGMMQVKPRIWQSLVPDADAYELEGNVRLGTAVMAHAIRLHGTWQKALTRVYFPSDDLNGTSQSAYVRAVESLLKEIEAVQPGPTPDEDEPEPSDELPFPLHVRLIPTWQTNQRPGIKMRARYLNIHETGNTRPGADAAMHAQWLHDGAPGGADDQVGVHFFVDDHEAYQTLPLDEVGWNAGCGSCDGNYAAIAIEICVNQDGDREQARRNAAILIGRLLRQLGLGMSAIKFHQDWSGKWCPAIILSQGLKPHMLQLVEAAYAGGGNLPDPIPEPVVYSEPSKVPGFDGSRDVVFNDVTFHAESRTVTAAQEINVRKYADGNSPLTRSPVQEGQTFPVLGWVEGQKVGDESRWWVTESYSRVWVGGTTEKPGDQQPKTYEHGTIIDGIRHYPTTRMITVKAGQARASSWFIDDGGPHWRLTNGQSVPVAQTPEHPE